MCKENIDLLLFPGQKHYYLLKSVDQNLCLIIKDDQKKFVQNCSLNCSQFFSEIPFHFHEIIRLVPLRYIEYLFVFVNTK